MFAAVLLAAPARAGLITPDSIPQPPPAVSAANHTPIPSADLVGGQYEGLGIQFGYPMPQFTAALAAITHLGGTEVWAPAFWGNASPANADLNYETLLGVQLVKPNSGTPAVASSVTVELTSQSDVYLILYAFDREGKMVGGDAATIGPGSQSVSLTASAAEISEFKIGYGPTVADLSEGPWGVAGIEFTPTAGSAPEPCGLALAGFGAAALAGWTWRRRRAQAASAL